MELIFNRTFADVAEIRGLMEQIDARGGFQNLTAEEQEAYLALHAKGMYIFTDFNRVEEATRFLNTQLVQYGYGVALETKTDWADNSIILLEDINRIRRNVDALQDMFLSIPEWREITYTMSLDFEQTNALEWDLQHIDIWLSRMIAAMPYLGTFYCGEDGVI